MTRSQPRRRTDAELFARHLAGDHDALMELFDRHNRRIYLYCSKIVNDDQLARDLTQEIWEKVIRMRSSGVEPHKKPLALILTMARNLCLNQLRSQRKLTPIHEISETQHPPENVRELTHLEELVVIALSRLPMAQREILILNAYSGYGFDEIAEMLGKPVGAVHTAAWRARTRLEKLITELMRYDDPGHIDGGDETEEDQ